MKTREQDMKRRLTIVAAIAASTLAIATAAPAASPTKGKPRRPAPVAVEMGSTGDSGLATSESCGGPLSMTWESSQMLRLDWGAIPGGFEANLGIAWSRSHPTEVGGPTFTGCHGGLVAGSDLDQFAGFLILAGQSNGAVELSSRFDYYWKGHYVQKGKKQRYVQDVLEFLEIFGELERTDGRPFDWSASGEPQTVTGDVELRLFEKLADGTGMGWHPFGSVPVEMTITIG